MKSILHGKENEAARDAGELPTLCRLLRAFSHTDQESFARAAGLSAVTLWRYEVGKTRPSRDALRRLSHAAKLPFERVERVLLPAVRALRGSPMAGNGGGEPPSRAPGAGSGPRDLAEGLLLDDYAQTLAAEPSAQEDGFALRDTAEPKPADRQDASYLAGCLLPHPPADRDYLLAQCEELSRWYLVEHLADHAIEGKTLAGAGRQPVAPLDLARVALQVAERVPGQAAWRSRVKAYALAALAHAQRAAGDPAASATAIAARKSWDEGAGAPPLLDEAKFRAVLRGGSG